MRRILAVGLVAGFLAVAPALAVPASKVVPSPDGVYVGHYSIGDTAEAYEKFTDDSDGRAAPIVFTFHDWNGAGVETAVPELQTFADPLEGEDSPSPLELARQVADDGGVLAVAWDAVGYFFEHPDYFSGGGSMPVTWDDVLSGEYDDYVREVAQEIREFGRPIMLSPAGEFNSIGYFSYGPNGDQQVIDVSEAELSNQYGDPSVPDGPERVRDLYRHVIDIFKEEGVENVTWFMYSNTSYLNPEELDPEERERIDAEHPRHYYPGDEYIDWIGSSIYVDADDPDRDVAYAVENVLKAFREVTDKPFFSPEFGIVSEDGADRSEVIRRVFEEELPNFPDIRALTFADSELFAQFFDLPRLGHVEGELEAWIEAVWESGLYANEVVTTRVPEPSGAAAMALLGAAVAGRRTRGGSR